MGGLLVSQEFLPFRVRFITEEVRKPLERFPRVRLLRKKALTKAHIKYYHGDEGHNLNPFCVCIVSDSSPIRRRTRRRTQVL